VDPAPTLAELRAALLRIGARVARLAVLLEPGLEPGAVRDAFARGLDAPLLGEPRRRALADAELALAGAPTATGPVPAH
jgi:hypothetical protein